MYQNIITTMIFDLSDSYWTIYLKKLSYVTQCISYVWYEIALYTVLQYRIKYDIPMLYFSQYTSRSIYVHGVHLVIIDQAPVPLSIFWSNSKFDENSKHSSVKYTQPITTIFCTRHDSVTVVTCAKYLCDRSNMFETRAFWIFIEFRIWSKYA